MRQIHHCLLCVTCFTLSISAAGILSASTIHEVSFTLAGMQEGFASSPVNRRTPPPGAPLDLTPSAASAMSLSLPTPEPDNDRLLTYQPGDPPSYASTIRAENAGDFGLNWEAFEDDLGENLFAVLRFGVDEFPFNGTVVGSTRTESGYSPELPPKEPWEFYSFEGRDVTIDEINVVVDYYFWHPIFPELRASKIGFEISGSYLTTVTIRGPEPSSLVLAGLGGLMVAARQDRRSIK